MYKVKIGGIYKIEHISGYYYIGMSVDIFSRWSNHYSDIKKMKHSSIDFMNLWNSSEPSDWSFSILEYVSITEYKKVSQMKGKSLENSFRTLLLKKEKEWMNKHSINYSLNKNKRYFS
jgi:hypothetical protein